jgi:hypothetical protein
MPQYSSSIFCSRYVLAASTSYSSTHHDESQAEVNACWQAQQNIAKHHHDVNWPSLVDPQSNSIHAKQANNNMDHDKSSSKSWTWGSFAYRIAARTHMTTLIAPTVQEPKRHTFKTRSIITLISYHPAPQLSSQERALMDKRSVYRTIGNLLRNDSAVSSSPCAEQSLIASGMMNWTQPSPLCSLLRGEVFLCPTKKRKPRSTVWGDVTLQTTNPSVLNVVLPYQLKPSSANASWHGETPLMIRSELVPRTNE